jgi:hypothetical protein
MTLNKTIRGLDEEEEEYEGEQNRNMDIINK